MDFVNVDAIIESVLTLSLPLEYVPDVVAWISCGLLALWLLRLVLSRRPRAFGACAISWLAWLGWQSWVNGFDIIEDTTRRGTHAINVTDKFVVQLVALVKAWTDFFLPFLSDVCRWLMSTWRTLSVRHRIFVTFFLITGYSIFEAVRFVRKHSQRIRKVLFHASFLIGGPVVWQLCGLLPPEWLEFSLSQVVTTLPTFFSLWVLSEQQLAPQASTVQQRRSLLFLRWNGSHQVADARKAEVRITKSRRQWLAYWCCWPLLALIEASLAKVPTSLPNYGCTQQLQYDLRRAMVTFVFWLVCWQGCVILHFTLESILRHTAILDRVAFFFGSYGVRLVQVLGGGGIRVTTMSSWSILRFVGKLGTRLWILVVGSVVVTGVVATLAWIFFSAVSMVSTMLTMLLWCFAAADSSDTLTKEVEGFYYRKLAFWVLAIAWEALTTLPYVGGALRLFTPVAFSLWLVAGEFVLRRAFLPLLEVAKWAVKGVVNTLASILEACLGCGAAEAEEEEDEGEGEDENEDEAESEEQENDGAVEQEAVAEEEKDNAAREEVEEQAGQELVHDNVEEDEAVDVDTVSYGTTRVDAALSAGSGGVEEKEEDEAEKPGVVPAIAAGSGGAEEDEEAPIVAAGVDADATEGGQDVAVTASSDNTGGTGGTDDAGPSRSNNGSPVVAKASTPLPTPWTTAGASGNDETSTLRKRRQAQKERKKKR
mmetsp:Transcript_57750/g.161040  ORF Transcript_57750/g.161040 Transcript_57750/m.161040 type:complete len:709 (-) Transcript_57750:127-2253(-)